MDLPSNATAATRGRLPAYYKTLTRPSTLQEEAVCVYHVECRSRASDRQDSSKMNQFSIVFAVDQSKIAQVLQVQSGAANL
jgi:hypothetical protein